MNETYDERKNGVSKVLRLEGKKPFGNGGVSKGVDSLVKNPSGLGWCLKSRWEGLLALGSQSPSDQVS